MTHFYFLCHFGVTPLHLLPPAQPLFSCSLFLTRSSELPMAEAQDALKSGESFFGCWAVL